MLNYSYLFEAWLYWTSIRNTLKHTHFQTILSLTYIHTETPFKLWNIHNYDFLILFQLFNIMPTFYTVTVQNNFFKEAVLEYILALTFNWSNDLEPINKCMHIFKSKYGKLLFQQRIFKFKPTMQGSSWLIIYFESLILTPLLWLFIHFKFDF